MLIDVDEFWVIYRFEFRPTLFCLGMHLSSLNEKYWLDRILFSEYLPIEKKLGLNLNCNYVTCRYSVLYTGFLLDFFEKLKLIGIERISKFV